MGFFLWKWSCCCLTMKARKKPQCCSTSWVKVWCKDVNQQEDLEEYLSSTFPRKSDVGFSRWSTAHAASARCCWPGPGYWKILPRSTWLICEFSFSFCVLGTFSGWVGWSWRWGGGCSKGQHAPSEKPRGGSRDECSSLLYWLSPSGPVTSRNALHFPEFAAGDQQFLMVLQSSSACFFFASLDVFWQPQRFQSSRDNDCPLWCWCSSGLPLLACAFPTQAPSII